MNDRYWPLFGLSLATRELTLRPMTEADLIPLADLLPADVELDPAATRFPMGEEPISRGAGAPCCTRATGAPTAAGGPTPGG